MLAWIVIAFIFYCLHAYSEVHASQMNYVSGVLVLITICMSSVWFHYATKSYKVVDI